MPWATLLPLSNQQLPLSTLVWRNPLRKLHLHRSGFLALSNYELPVPVWPSRHEQFWFARSWSLWREIAGVTFNPNKQEHAAPHRRCTVEFLLLLFSSPDSCSGRKEGRNHIPRGKLVTACFQVRSLENQGSFTSTKVVVSEMKPCG